MTKQEFINTYQPAIVDTNGTRKDEIWEKELEILILNERAAQHHETSLSYFEILERRKQDILKPAKPSNFQNG